MGDLVSIKAMKKELLIDMVEQLRVENERLMARIERLERLPVPAPVVRVEITPEEIICVEQIDILKSKSANRELSLDECKRLDLLVKNLRLIRNESTEVINTTNYSTINEDDLVAIATSRREGTE